MKLYDLILCIPPIGQVNYPYTAVPLLSSVVAQNGYSVALSDANIDLHNYIINRYQKRSSNKDANVLNEEFLELNPCRLDREFEDNWIKTYSTMSRVFGFSLPCYSSLPWTLRIAEGIKENQRDALIVFGGAFCDRITAKYILSKYKFVDIVVIGEGENSLVEILQKFYSSGRISLESLRGIGIRTHLNMVVINETRQPLSDLNSLPFADYSCVPLEDYLNFKVGVRVLPIVASRGCFCSCSFCSERNMWERYRVRCAENIVEEIKYQLYKHHVKIFRFNDSVLNASIRRLERLCDLLIEADLDVEWVGNVRVRSDMSYRLLQKMYNAGCRVLWYGIESASPKLLKIMKKDVDIKEVPRVLKETKKAGIMVLTFWITDFPGETLDDTRKTIEFFRTYGKYIDFAHFSKYHLHKNSEMFSHPDKYGIIIKDLDRFGNPVWTYSGESSSSAQILESVGRIYINQTRLPWNFVGAV